LTPAEAPFVDHDIADLDGDPACEENLQSNLLAGSNVDLALI